MARKSRKPNNQALPVSQKSSLIPVAAYVRRSAADSKARGYSIETQQLIINQHIALHPDFTLYDTYIDTSTGTNFDRENFQRMMQDAEAGKIRCVIVKDLSRLGRNMIETGYYIERVFLPLALRLIAITDDYDSDIKSSYFSMPMINLMNEEYAVDISKKIGSQIQVAMKEGIYVGGSPPYGYVRSSEDRHKLVIDKPVAEVVQRIFDWASRGNKAHEIARRLNASNVLPPALYYSRSKSEKPVRSSGLWYARTVDRILSNPIYIGRLVQGKTKSVHFRRQAVEPDKWIRVDNTHEAIIPLALFQRVQELKQPTMQISKTSEKQTYTPNLFRGKIFCAHCGSPLERKKDGKKYSYRCVLKRTAPGRCEGNNISEDTVKQALIEQLLLMREQLEGAIDKPSSEKTVLPELQWIQMELSYLFDITRGLYENFVRGILTQREYIELKETYQARIDAHNRRTEELRNLLDDENQEILQAQKALDSLDTLAEARVLLPEHVERFAERVLVLGGGKVHFELLNATTI